METAKFKCEYCNKYEYDIVEKEYINHVGEKHIKKVVISKCCNTEYSIDYLYLHIPGGNLHSR